MPPTGNQSSGPSDFLARPAADCDARLDRDGNISEISQTITALLGYEPSELLGRNCLGLLHPDDAQDARLMVERCASEPGFVGVLEVRPRKKDGSYRRFAVLGRNCLDDPRGAAIRLECRDVTDLPRGLEAIRVLLDIQRELVSTTDPDKLADRIVSAVLWLFRAKRAILYHAASQSAGLVCVATAGEADPSRWLGQALPPEAAAGGRAAATGAAQRTTDLGADPSWRLPGWLEERLHVEGCPAAASAPLIAGGETLGAVVVHDVAGRHWSDEEMTLLSAFADQAALAFRNARAHQRAEQRAERLRTLHGLAALISSAGTLGEMVEAVASAAGVLLHARLARVLLADPHRRVFRVAATFGLDRQVVEAVSDRIEIPVTQGLVGVISGTGRPVCVRDVQRDPRVVEMRLARLCGLHGYAGFPLLVDGQTAGILCVLFGEARLLGDEERELLEVLSGHAAIALRRARAEEENRYRKQATEALVEVGRVVSLSLEPELVARRIAESLRRLLGATHAAFRRVDPETGEAVALAYAGEQGPLEEHPTRFPAGVGIVGLAVSEARPVVTADVLADPRVTLTPALRRWTERAGYRSVLAVPLIVEDKVVGVLSASRPAERPLGDEDVALVQAFAYQAEIALANSELYAELRGAFDRRQEADERLRGLVGGIDALVWEADAAGRLTFVSRGAGSIAGPGVEGMATLRELWERLAHPEDLQRLMAFLDLAAGEGTSGVTEHRVMAPDGHVLHVLHRVRATREAAGRLDRFRGVVVDITAEKRIEEQQRLRATVTRILAEAPTVRGAIQEVLRAVGSLLGWDLGEMWLLDREAGLMRWEDMWSAPGVDGDAFGEASAGLAFPLGAGLPGRTWAQNAPLWVPDVLLDHDFARAEAAAAQGFHAAFAFPIRAAREVTGVMLFLSRDVRPADPLLLDAVADLGEHIGQFAERKRMEEALARSEERLRQAQRLEGLGRLAGGVAHDFNNLLTVIIGRSALLQAVLEEKSGPRRYADIVHDTAERAAALTRQLLAFSRQQMLESRVLDLNDVVTGIEEMLRRLIREDIHLVVERAPGLWSVKADPTQVEQVLMNLVVNARDAMPEGGRLTIRLTNAEVAGAVAARHPGGRPGLFAVLEVSDTGSGMSPEVQARIFEPFFTTKELGRGTGLGLATTYGIIRQHGGWIEVRSQPGHGTTFRIYLPRVDEATAGPEAAGEEGKARLTGSETILLAEDEEVVRRVLVEMLEMLGYRVIEARGPAEALEHAEQMAEPIHLLVTDVVMPGMRGPELARVLTALRPEMRVLFISGHADDAVFSGGVVPEGMTLLPKPFSPEALGRKVREVLDRPE